MPRRRAHRAAGERAACVFGGCCPSWYNDPMSRRTIISLAAVVCLSGHALADPPDGYYDSVDASDATFLRNTLHAVIDGRQNVEYDWHRPPRGQEFTPTPVARRILKIGLRVFSSFLIFVLRGATRLGTAGVANQSRGVGQYL